MTLHHTTSIDDAVAATGDYRAGGTDLQERLRHDVLWGDGSGRSDGATRR